MKRINYTFLLLTLLLLISIPQSFGFFSEKNYFMTFPNLSQDINYTNITQYVIYNVTNVTNITNTTEFITYNVTNVTNITNVTNVTNNNNNYFYNVTNVTNVTNNTYIGGNTSWNESYADTLYYRITNPNNYLNNSNITGIYSNITFLQNENVSIYLHLNQINTTVSNLSGNTSYMQSSIVNLYATKTNASDFTSLNNNQTATNLTLQFLRNNVSRLEGSNATTNATLQNLISNFTTLNQTTGNIYTQLQSTNATAGYTFSFLSSIFTNISNVQASILNLYATKTNTTDFQSLNENQTATNLTLQNLIYNYTLDNIKLTATNNTATNWLNQAVKTTSTPVFNGLVSQSNSTYLSNLNVKSSSNSYIRLDKVGQLGSLILSADNYFSNIYTDLNSGSLSLGANGTTGILVVNGTNTYVGIGTNNPTQKLTVSGNILTTNTYSLVEGSNVTALNSTLTSTNATASTRAGTGNCPAGQVVGNTTVNGVECLTVSSSGDNASWNESYANTLYVSKSYSKVFVKAEAFLSSGEDGFGITNLGGNSVLNPVNASDINHPGIVKIFSRPSTTASGQTWRYNNFPVVLTSNSTFISIFKPYNQTGNGTFFQVGFMNSTGSTTDYSQESGAYFFINQSGFNGFNVVPITVSNNVRTTGSSFTINATGWIRTEIYVNSANSVIFNLYNSTSGVLINSQNLTTNIPYELTNDALTIALVAFTNIGSPATDTVLADFDYISFEINKNLQR